MRLFLSFLLFVLLSACSPTDLLAAGVSSDTYSVQRDISYEPGDHHQLDIYKPVQPADGKPVLVFFFGGAWQHGDKEDMKFVAEPLAASGITVVVPNYRLAPEVAFPAFLQDGAAAMAWTRQHIADYGGNPKNLFIGGHSAGGYIAAMLALNPVYLKQEGMTPDDLAGVVGVAGPYNFLPITWPELKPIFEVVPDLNVTQPISFVDGHNPPMLLTAGLDDETVNPQDNTDALYRKIISAGGPAVEKLYPGVGHVGIILGYAPLFRGNAPIMSDTLAFIAEHKKTE